MEANQQSLHKYLINRSQQGDRKAQNELYRLYVDAMYNISRRMMGDSEEARDILQDSFIDAFLKLKTLKNEATFGSWLKRIVINHCINALKKKRIMTSPLDDHWEGTAIQESEGDQEIVRNEAGRIVKAIDHISEGCKVVLNLYLFEGYDHKEIASILNVTEATSKAQYCKAKAKVRKILAEKTI